MANSTLQAIVKDVYGNSTLPPAVTTPLYPPEFYTLNAVANFLNTIYIWIIFAVGFPGNVLSVIVITRMSKHVLATALLNVAVLSVVDNVAIILKIIDNQAAQRKLSIDETGCQFLVFFGSTCSVFANWILIIISAERFTAVAFPMKVRLFWSLRKSVGIMVGVFLLLCLVHSHSFVTVTHTDIYGCTGKITYRQFFYPLWYFTSATVYSFLPATLIIIFNILIILFLRKYSRQRRRISTDVPAQIETQRQERQITIMLVIIAAVFVILTIPQCVYVILYFNMCSDGKDLMCLSRKRFFGSITTQLADTNHAINFYLYFLSGSKFREEFLKLFRCGRVPYTDVSSGNTQVSEVPVAESGM